jgi:predicted 3-demethylubiquinone-9 3-methyltransferase (glyoxalase superfamily)
VEPQAAKEAKSQPAEVNGSKEDSEEARIAAQKIIPFLWFNSETEEAMNLYTSIFENSKIDSICRYPSGVEAGPMAGMDGKVLNGSFHLGNQQFLGLDGGPIFKFTPAISLFVNCDTEQEVDHVWAKVSPGGNVFMELSEYPWSKKFGWTSDKYGLSWQVCLGPRKHKISPFMMFVGPNHGKAEEAIKFYTSLFPNSGITEIERWAAGNDPEVEGTIKRAVFQLCGNEYVAMESKHAHDFNFNEALSLMVDCADQAEIDFFWDKLSAHPESEQCGWVKDKYGVSWQIVPSDFLRCMKDPNPIKSRRAIDALMTMKKIDIADVKKAFESEPPQEQVL